MTNPREHIIFNVCDFLILRHVFYGDIKIFHTIIFLVFRYAFITVGTKKDEFPKTFSEIFFHVNYKRTH